MEKIYFLKSENIILKPIEVKELPKIAGFIEKWSNDPIVTYYLFTGQRPKNKKQITENLKKELESGNNVVFLIVDIETENPIGYVGLYDINSTVRKAEFRILIGEKDFWGRGYGTQITELVTFYGFDRLNLNRIYLGYTSSNERAGRAYEKAGYVYEGTLKEDLYRNSTYYDSTRMAVLRKDYCRKFYKSYLKKYVKNNGKQ